MTMQARMRNPVMFLPDAMKAMLSLAATTDKSGVPARTVGLIQLRGDHITAVRACADVHGREMTKAGETEERLFAVAPWRDAPCFTDAEPPARALAGAVPRIADRPAPVPAEIGAEAARHYDER